MLFFATNLWSPLTPYKAAHCVAGSGAVSHCIIWYQSELILTTCQIHYHSHWWKHGRNRQLCTFIA